ncbi:hypothetical protein ACFOOP_18235 [Marinicaulis aureus]|uniref:TNase-like domain-containing protein n=1 Tax=Hyphococcus aureus TaxID=2666033 RepID=A0ABW1KXS1_9PROT
MKRRYLLGGVLALGVSRSFAQTIVPNAQALSGSRFLAGDVEYLLADVMAPPLYVLGDQAPAYFERSRIALQALLSSRVDVEDALPPTRWGVKPVIVKVAGAEETLQETLTRAGAVRVTPQTENHDFIRRLLALEQEARTGKTGLWALQDYRIFDADKAYGAVGAYNLIEGTVLRAEKHGSRFYLNFGEDFREDFTAGAASRLYTRWLKSGVDLAAFDGANIRVRGFVEAINGPSIDLKHPLQIERLD